MLVFLLSPKQNGWQGSLVVRVASVWLWSFHSMSIILALWIIHTLQVLRSLCISPTTCCQDWFQHLHMTDVCSSRNCSQYSEHSTFLLWMYANRTTDYSHIIYCSFAYSPSQRTDVWHNVANSKIARICIIWNLFLCFHVSVVTDPWQPLTSSVAPMKSNANWGVQLNRYEVHWTKPLIQPQHLWNLPGLPNWGTGSENELKTSHEKWSIVFPGIASLNPPEIILVMFT